MRPSRRRSTEHSALTTLDPSRESHRQPRVRASGMGGSQKNAERFKRIFYPIAALIRSPTRLLTRVSIGATPQL